MTVEQFKKDLEKLCLAYKNGPSEEYYAYRDCMIADYELLEGEYQYWVSLGLKFLSWSHEVYGVGPTGDEKLDRLIDMVVCGVGG